MRRAFAFLSALLLVASAVLPFAVAPAVGAPGGNDALASTTSGAATATNASPVRNGSIHFDYRLALLPDDPDNVQVGLTLSVPSDVSTMEISLPRNATVVGSQNLTEVDAAETGFDYRWRRGNGAPSITYRTDPDDENGLFGGLDSTDAGSWAFVVDTAVEPSVVTRPVLDPPRTSSMRVDGEGVGGTTMAYLGPVTVRSRTVSGTEVRLVVPEGIEFDADPAFAALTNASRLLRVGDRPPRTTAFVTRDPIRTGGLYAVPSEAVQQSPAGAENFWVHAVNEDDRSVHANVWVHEYVHARQGFDTTDGMAWLDEAIGSYYESLLTLYATDAGFGPFYRSVSTTEYAGEPLYDDGSEVQYEKGMRVIAAIDARIHNETDGERSFQDVFARLNRQDRVGINTFVETVEAVAGTELEAWLTEPTFDPGAPVPPARPALYDHTEVDVEKFDASAEADGIDPPTTETYTATATDTEIDAFGTEIDTTDTDTTTVPETGPITPTATETGSDRAVGTGEGSTSRYVLGGVGALAALVGLGAGARLVLRYRGR